MILFSGYMAPEYAIYGLFSVKSDVFSFGVLMLEIVSGKKNRGFSHSNNSINLIGQVSVKLKRTCFFFCLQAINIGNDMSVTLFRHGDFGKKPDLWTYLIHVWRIHLFCQEHCVVSISVFYVSNSILRIGQACPLW